ncbi:GNAT family N-acetyltransferase [Nocardioides sp. R-C-SC26]|uniref:GNAT family N-acetyltransferase n=1 Tax=Nocardioides sp. R-C-SC26 TaxID=2870414 RepID=UPI001E54CF5D|nr:GNAT family N-acetyltransferase [Nocardioides sp. R-C-SC26]
MADLRSATPDDVVGLRSLGEAVLPATYDPIDPALSALILDEWWAVDRLAEQVERLPHVVAEAGGEIVGMANLGRRGDREVMWKLYVHPQHQGSGLGARLLAATEDLVEGDALWLEHVAGNDQAAGFYARHGFAEVERVANPPYPDDVWMRKALR